MELEQSVSIICRRAISSMLVATWPSDQQQAALDLEKNLIQSLSIRTDKAGFSVSILEHSNLWHQQALQEDWLAEYTPLAWERPFQARWMGEFFASPGGNASFQKPYNDYSFPIANAKTRMSCPARAPFWTMAWQRSKQKNASAVRLACRMGLCR